MMVNVTLAGYEYQYILNMLKKREEDIHWGHATNELDNERLLISRLIKHLEE